MNRIIYILIVMAIGLSTSAQYTISGIVKDTTGNSISGATVLISGTTHFAITELSGTFRLSGVKKGNYTLGAYAEGKRTSLYTLNIQEDIQNYVVILKDFGVRMNDINIESERDKNYGLTRMGAVENFAIYEGKKTEVIDLKNFTGNAATNNPRQVYAKVTGLNIWESDGAGLQLGIGGRGLSPNRTANFNVRQNGYDISADALGYPESYYTPPIEALDRIEVIRGAASLQYGTQFGGMLNFKFKQGNQDKKIELVSRQTVGSWGFYNSFNSVGGTVAKGKLNYYGYFQFKRGDGFRPNSGFGYYNAYGSLEYRPLKNWTIGIQITKMNYLAQQPGGLTDKNFRDNPVQSVRSRNWFAVDWNMAALISTLQVSRRVSINTRFFGLSAGREALGNLERINVADLGGNRTLISGVFRNLGNETRVQYNYKLRRRNGTLISGIRTYYGRTTAIQGDANSGKDADFYYLNPGNPENSSYVFSNENYSIFAENKLDILHNLSITIGLRYEHIGTFANGYFKTRVFDGAGNLISELRTDESRGRRRNFVIGGLAVNYRFKERFNLYANFSQNYRAINFSDLRVDNPNYKVDPNIQDESGFTADLGIRGKKDGFYSFEVTGFLLYYNNKIGQILKADQPPLYLDYRFRGNISDARNLGIEAYGEVNLPSLWRGGKQKTDWLIFANMAWVDARYIHTQESSIRNKFVEMVPPFMLRTGSQVKIGGFRGSVQYSWLARQYSDATNAVLTSTAVEGIIPSYGVMDCSLGYTYKNVSIEGSINNVLNSMYFTRRAESYPGPGIIPGEGRGFYVTVQVKY
jgi:Fe(3+) dicitrate transport protein